MPFPDIPRPQTEPRQLDRAIAALAARQHGVVGLRQLGELGLSDRAVRHRAAGGRLHRLHRGVYAVGHSAISVDGRRLAAVLACGEGAVLSHRSAARAWGLLAGDGRRWDVSAPSRAGGRRGSADVALHHLRRLDAVDVTVLRAIPITTVERTLVDLAGVLDADRLERAVHEAEVLRVLDVRAVEATLARLPRRKGCATLRALLAEPSPGPTRLELEEAFLRLCRRHQLPVPRLNHAVDLGDRVVTVDAFFAAGRVIVELDSERCHHTRRNFHGDRRRDAALAARGHVVVRLTWQRVMREPGATAAELAQTLRARITQFQDTSSRRPGTFITDRAHGQ